MITISDKYPPPWGGWKRVSFTPWTSGKGVSLSHPKHTASGWSPTPWKSQKGVSVPLKEPWRGRLRFKQNVQNFLRSRLRRSREYKYTFWLGARQKSSVREPVRLTQYEYFITFTKSGRFRSISDVFAFEKALATYNTFQGCPVKNECLWVCAFGGV